MPRQKRSRHFDARYGVSQPMVDAEAVHVARELADYLTLSLNDLRQKLYELRGKWREADQTAEALVQALPERDALAFQCLLVRDLFLVLALYGDCLRAKRDELGSQPVIPSEPPRPWPSPVVALPFNPWLFDPVS